MKKISCILADDEPLALRLLETYVSRIPMLENAGSYTSATDAMDAIRQKKAEIAFLDIQMPQMSGLELARIARDSGVNVIFVTAYRDFALEGFRVNALNYLLKPVSFDEFEAAVQRAAELLPSHDEKNAPEETCMMVRSDYRLVKVDFDDVLYIEGLKDYVKIYTESRERPLITQMSLKAVEHTLPSDRFMRVHRSFIVALDKIASIGRTNALIGKSEIPIGETYRSQVFEWFGLK